MLKLGPCIRLTPQEQAEFRRDTGRQQLPRTIDDHDAALSAAVSYWEAIAQQEQCAEAQFLAVVLAQKLIRSPHEQA